MGSSVVLVGGVTVYSRAVWAAVRTRSRYRLNQKPNLQTPTPNPQAPGRIRQHALQQVFRFRVYRESLMVSRDIN
ncbi:hypothetical protein GGR53DRAFT_481597 [Hypoxylon sp. FL1150]|nr:hypothetical protein GGR53DRAFT_481597 [Hypoxylon sp. FL1150]